MEEWKKKLGKEFGIPINERRKRRDKWDNKGKHRDDTAKRRLPDKFIFDSFYDEKGNMREKLFYELPEELAGIFKDAKLETTQLRKIYNAFQTRIMGPLRMKQIDFEAAKARFGVFYTENIVRQNKRGQVPDEVADFVKRHKSVILSSEKEMQGFYRYLTSILCYFA